MRPTACPATPATASGRHHAETVPQLQGAAFRSDRGHVSNASSVGPAPARAGEMIHHVAELEGRVDSLTEAGTHVIDGDGEYVVGEPHHTSGRS